MIRQFDVLANPSARSRAVIPFIVALQSHFLEEMPTVLVAPLVRIPPDAVYTRVALPVTFQDEDLMLSLAEMAAVSKASLSAPVGNLASHEDAIRRALDRLFTGF